MKAGDRITWSRNGHECRGEIRSVLPGRFTVYQDGVPRMVSNYGKPATPFYCAVCPDQNPTLELKL